MSYLKLENVKKNYVSGAGTFTALNNVSFELENGEFVVTGQSESDDVEGMTDFEYGGSVIVKFDEDGNVKWQKHLGIEDYNTIYELYHKFLVFSIKN